MHNIVECRSVQEIFATDLLVERLGPLLRFVLTAPALRLMPDCPIEYEVVGKVLMPIECVHPSIEKTRLALAMRPLRVV